MNTESYLELNRSAQYANKFRRYSIVINGFEKGAIEDGGKVKIPLAPGKHEVYLKIDWCRSNKVVFDIGEQGIIRLKCGSTVAGWRLFNPFLMIYYTLFKTNNYLYLRREEQAS